MTVPDWVNDLHVLQFGRGYWINMTQAITLRLRGATVGCQAAQAADMPGPPATFYGAVLPGPGFTPAAGMRMKAKVGNVICGQAETQRAAVGRSYTASRSQPTGQAPRPAAARPAAPCVSRWSTRLMATVAAWDNNRVQEVPLSPWDERSGSICRSS